MLLADRPTTSRWAPPPTEANTPYQVRPILEGKNRGRHFARKTPSPGSQIALEPDLGSAFDPTRTVARAGTHNATPGLLSVGQTGSKRTIGSATSRSRGSPTPGDPFATLAITRAPAANPQNVGSRSHLLKWSRRSLSATPRIRCLLVSARSVLTRRSIERSRPVLIRSFRAPPPAATAWPLYPRPAIKFALDADNRLLLDVRPGPKQKCRSRGRLGDQAVTRNETASGWSSSTWALAKRARRCGCLLRCC